MLGEAAYKKNIAIHAATKEIPCVVVFGIKPWKETNNNDVSIANNEANNEATTIITRSSSSHKRAQEDQSEQRKKIKNSVNENQEHYNAKMKKARGKPSLFRVDEMVGIKIDKVDKTSPLHPNVLIGKILHIENNYTKVATNHGIISTFISTNRLSKCTITNNVLITPKRSLFQQLANKPSIK